MTGVSRAVFLSYASEDAAAARRICAALRAAGIEVWFDQSELRGGDAWDRQIRKQVQDCALFIAIVSAHSDARDEGYFRREWRLAVQRTQDMADDRAFLLPVAVDETLEARARVPEEFRSVQWTRLPPGDIPAAFVDRVKRLLHAAPTADAAPIEGVSGPAPARQNPATPSRAPAGTVSTYGRPAVLALALAILVVGGYFMLQKMVRSPAHATAASGAHTAAPATAAPTAATQAIPQKSIAVLPFVDMSEKRDQEYFSDGLTEELIDHLAHAPDLKVIARTSSFAFKGKNEDVRTIAGKLGVANLLEGSVRKSGNELRVTAQLIRAADGIHLWSQAYDRNLKDIFKLQDEIATTVSNALQVALSPSATGRPAKTTNMEAYSLVLQGNFFFARGNKGDSDEAIARYSQAVRIQPDFALAWAKLARTYSSQINAGEAPIREGAENARHAAQRALEIDPDCALAHYALGSVHWWFDYDWAAATHEYEQALALDPQGDIGADARENLGEVAASQSGPSEELIKLYIERIRVNPLDALELWSLAWQQQFAGRLEDAAATSRRLLSFNPNYITAQAQYAQTLLLMGQASAALEAAQRETDEPTRLAALACIQWTLGHKAESEIAARKLEADHAETSAYLVATYHAWRDDANAAFTWLDRAYRQHDTLLVSVKLDPMLRNLHGDPRFRALLLKMRLST